MLERLTGSPAVAHHYRLVLAVALAVAVMAATTASVSAQWPTGCEELNDIVERHLGNDGNVGIYQLVFGEQAEDACQNDHIEDVRGVFAWALAASDLSDAGDEGLASDGPEDIGSWPETCVELNDIVENHLGNDRNVGIYQRTFDEQAETACRQDHADDVRDVFGWAAPCQLGQTAPANPASTARPTNPTSPTFQHLALSDSALRGVLVTLPWLGCHVYPWLADGVSGHDYRYLESLMNLARINESFAMEVASYPWFTDGIDFYREAEWGALRDLTKIAQHYPELLSEIRELPWITDQRPDPTGFALLSLERLAASSVELAILTATSPWMLDGVADHEAGAVAALGELAKQDLSLAKQLLAYTLDPTVKATDVLAIPRIIWLRRDDPDRFHRLVNRAWFADGLDAEERAFMVVLGSNTEPLYSQLFERHYTQSKTITLPLAGEVTLWAIDWEPFPSGEDSLQMAAEAARELERFWGVGFPFDSIVFSFVGYENSPHGFPAAFVGDGVIIVRDFYPRLDRNVTDHRRVVYHEIAHYYFNELGPYYSGAQAGPNWLDEGGANFMEAYIDSRLGFQPLPDRLQVVETSAREDCHKHGYQNILSLIEPSAYGDGKRWRGCMFILGEHLVLSLFFAMGESGLSAALREMYWTSHFFRPFPLRHSSAYPSDLQAYQTFLKHTPPGREDAVRDVYQRIHGGPYIPPDN